MGSQRPTRNTSTLSHNKSRASRARQPCFTLKRPMVFQVRKSLVEYVDDELTDMHTSVFYQRIFIFAKNLDSKRVSLLANAAAQGGAAAHPTTPLRLSKEQEQDADAGGGKAELGGGEADRYSQVSTQESSRGKDMGDEDNDSEYIHITVTVQPEEKETFTNIYRFDVNDDEDDKPAEKSSQLEIVTAEAEPEKPQDMYTLFGDKLRELQRKCRYLAYTPDPICGIYLYMNDYTMLMLESGEDVLGIFCRELAPCLSDYWENNRVFMIEDHIQMLYTKDLLFRRIPAAWINEKFPTSTPTDEFLMGKQHLIIKDKLHMICQSITEMLGTSGRNTATDVASPVATDMSEHEGNDSSDDDAPTRSISYLSTTQPKNVSSVISESLPPETFRKLLPEIQRIELVLASTRFYYTLDEFSSLYGKVPHGRDDDGLFWPIQNNYAPPNIFRRTPYDINLTFADYAAEMNQRMLEEQEKQRAEQEAAAAADAAHAEEQAREAQTKQAHREAQDQDTEAAADA